MTRKLLARNLVVALTIALALVGLRPALAAPQQQEVTPGIYTSEPVTLPSGSEVDFSLFLSEDGSAGFITSLTDQSDSYNEYGDWEMTDDGLVSVTLTGDDEAEYDEPYTTTFSQDGDTLTTVDFDTEYFGEDGFSVTLAMTEEELMASEADAGVGGMYTSEAIVAEDGSVGVALLYLAEDGTAQGNINYFDGVTPPDVQLGAWTDNEDGTITLLLDNMLQVSADGAEPVEMDEPVERDYEVGDEGELVGENLTLYPLTSVELGADEDAAATDDVGYVSFSSEELTSADTPGLVISFTFYEDGSFEAASDYMNDEPAVMEYGSWEEDEDANATVTITGDDNGDYEQPLVFTVVSQDDGSILAVNEEVFGADGLVLWPDEE